MRHGHALVIVNPTAFASRDSSQKKGSLVNHPQFDQFTRVIAATRSRRALAQALAILPFASASHLLFDEVAAKRQRQRNQAQSEKKNKKKVAFCLNGQTITASASKKSKKKLKKKGAIPGACRTCKPACVPGKRCCGTTCVSGPWSNQTVFGSEGSGSSNFGFPSDVALTPDGLTAWIADRSNNRIAVWARPNATSTAWVAQTTFGSLGSGPSNLKNPSGVSVTPDGLMVLVRDTDNNRVSVWTRPNASGAWTNQTTFGSFGTGASNFDYPVGGAVSGDGLTAWVADYRNDRISVWTRTSPTSAFSNQTTFGSSGSGSSNLNVPLGVAISPDGLTAWIVDTNNNRISVWSRPNAGSSAWNNQTTFGSFGDQPSNFFSPQDVTVSSDSLTAWVSDGSNRRIAVWTRPNASSTAWVNQTLFGSNGAGPSNFKSPQGIAISQDGLSVLVADIELRRISVWGIVCPA